MTPLELPEPTSEKVLGPWLSKHTTMPQGPNHQVKVTWQWDITSSWENYKTNEESEEWGFLGFTWLILSDCLAFLIISAPCSDQEPLHCLAQRPMKPYNGYYNALQTLQTLQTLQAEDLFSGNQSKTPIARNRANELPKKKLSTSSPGTWYGHGMSWL